MGVDYTLSILRMANPSLNTHYHLVSEPHPCPADTGLGFWLRIIQSMFFFTIPSISLRGQVRLSIAPLVEQALRKFPSIWKCGTTFISINIALGSYINGLDYTVFLIRFSKQPNKQLPVRDKMNVYPHQNRHYSYYTQSGSI